MQTGITDQKNRQFQFIVKYMVLHNVRVEPKRHVTADLMRCLCIFPQHPADGGMDDEEDRWPAAFFGNVFSLAVCSSSEASKRQEEQPDSVSVQSDGEQDSTGNNIRDGIVLS